MARQQSWDPRSLIPFLATALVLGAVLQLAPELVPAPVRRLLGAGAERLGHPPRVSGSGSYTFMAYQERDPAQPVAYDPCEPVKVQVNPAGGPADAVALTRSVIAEVARATGLKIEYVGTTRDRPAWDDVRTPTFFGVLRSHPVLVSWATAREVPPLSDDVAGIGGSLPRADYQRVLRYVTGGVTLDTDTFAALERSPDGRTEERAIMLHEFGHLVGLGHVDDPNELMNADNVGLTDFGTGDRIGLAKLGSGSCA